MMGFLRLPVLAALDPLASSHANASMRPKVLFIEIFLLSVSLFFALASWFDLPKPRGYFLR
eukprot:m.18350 g.18350  ORF g.18350 m.18350 type:complete len:61 (+) comp30057_c0_seq1:1-183(+)